MHAQLDCCQLILTFTFGSRARGPTAKDSLEGPPSSRPTMEIMQLPRRTVQADLEYNSIVGRCSLILARCLTIVGCEPRKRGRKITNPQPQVSFWLNRDFLSFGDYSVDHIDRVSGSFVSDLESKLQRS